MSLGSMLAEANIGKIARQGDRIVAQNDEIIALLKRLVEQKPEDEAARYVLRNWSGPVREVRG